MSSGGTRTGSGRKAMATADKRKKVCITLSPEAYAILQDMRKRKVKVGRLIDDFLIKTEEDMILLESSLTIEE